MKVLLFSSYRDAAGQRELELTLPTGATVRDAAARLEADYPDLKLKGALAARNEVYAGPDEALEAGDTLAFFPPVAGGSGKPEDWFFVTDKALDVNIPDRAERQNGSISGHAQNERPIGIGRRTYRGTFN